MNCEASLNIVDKTEMLSRLLNADYVYVYKDEQQDSGDTLTE